MSLFEHAKKEFEILRVKYSTDPKYQTKDVREYEKLIEDSVLKLISTFAEQGHSSLSGSITLDLFIRLANYENLTPPTSDPTQWNEVGPNTWQSTRNPELFSTNGGKSWYSINDPKRVLQFEE